MTPGTLVTVLGPVPGVVVAGKAKEGHIFVAYRMPDGTMVQIYVPTEYVKPRSMK